MKKTKFLLLSLMAMLFCQQVSYAQMTINSYLSANGVCYGDMVHYSFDNAPTNTTVTSVSINPSNAGTVLPFGNTSATIIWNSNLTTATITVNYTYDEQELVTGGCKDANNKPYDCYITKRKASSATSSTIGLKAPTGNISGPTSIVCTDPTDVTYTVNGTHTSFSILGYPTNGNGAWTLSSSSQANSTFTMHPNVGVSGNISVSIVDANCNNSSSIISLNNITRPAEKPKLTAPSSATTQSAIKDVPVTFTVGVIQQAASYTFSAVLQNTSSSENVVIEPRGSTSLNATITFKYSGTYTLTVGYTGGDPRCGNGATKDYTINVTCPEPNNIAVCPTTQLASLPYSGNGVDGELYPRFMEDINNDGRADIMMFTASGLSVSLSNMTTNTYSALSVISTYWNGNSSTWPKQSITPRHLADVDGVNGLDIVGFALNGIYVSLNNGSGGFAAPTMWSNASTPAFWSGSVFLGLYTPGVLTKILFGDINGDLKEDLIYFNATNTMVMYSKANNPGFKVPEVIANCDFFNATSFPNPAQTPSRLKDMNNDNRLDIIMFTNNGVRVSLQNSNYTFNAPTNWSTYLGSADGYPNQSEYPRLLKDMNNDGYEDIIAFGTNFVRVAINNKAGAFLDPVKWAEGYSVDNTGGGTNSGYVNMDVNPRLIGDVDGDGYPDLIGFKQNFVAISKNINGTGFACPDYEYQGASGNGGAYTGNIGYTSQNYFPRYLVNIDGDARMEIVGFSTNKIEATICNSTSYFRKGIDETSTVSTTSNVLSCYPNPASDVINFKIENRSENAQIIIYDATGSKVKEITNEDLKSGSYTLNTLGLLNGVYYYQYGDGSGILKSDKFIIMK